MGGTCLLLGAGLYGIDHTIVALRLILSVLYFGFGEFAILFVEEVIPRREARGSLRVGPRSLSVLAEPSEHQSN